ncbi:hypothetical protein STSP2_03123 [Anaerohalosphaera lusitana]|uniref:Uncharacterized protein n=1 Tax=Anaerohalosphaera lusitana TaxID=1936003 RepID=A0A1U9NPT0_9BACT|nr:hypothetical protein STSP2_03123 [Anaerohalosphaera lusitana]
MTIRIHHPTKSKPQNNKHDSPAQKSANYDLTREPLIQDIVTQLRNKDILYLIALHEWLSG